METLESLAASLRVIIAMVIIGAIAVLKDYERQRREGIREPVFHPRVLKRPELVDADVWPPGMPEPGIGGRISGSPWVMGAPG
ncbi:hypothetical protein ACOJCM_04255 [Billgrantia sp. LNSP4103-1]|uniref:hypothetical protein n=1 Tax=Billgrantia sp. LNSP4103-1 TaxID=3410266 RepID=UPI00403FB6F1